MWMCVVKLFSSRYFYNFSLIFTKLGTRSNSQKVWQTDFRNFDFKILGKLLKF